jgi:hypothetical protein
MPKITCLCGETINLSQIPNPHGFKVISERIFDALVEHLAEAYAQSASQTEFEKRVYERLYLKTHGIAQAYECPACGRLAIFAHPSDVSPALWFQREKAHTQQTDSLASLIDQVTKAS